MALNDRKIINIIMDECRSVDERCRGYRRELVEVVADIVATERQHRIQGTNIQQKIADKCNSTGRFLAENRARDKNGRGGF